VGAKTQPDGVKLGFKSQNTKMQTVTFKLLMVVEWAGYVKFNL
jgi:hypothetical protein